MEIKIPTNAVDIYRMLPEGTRCEVIFNELSMSPSPSTEHQLLSSKINALLYLHLEASQAGTAIASPIDVYFENLNSAVQPDIIVILSANNGIIQHDGIYGSPDLIIEILSSNHKHDTVKKKNLYEKAGVKEYFIVDQTSKIVSKYGLNQSNLYELIYKKKGKIESSLLNYTFTI